MTPKKYLGQLRSLSMSIRRTREQIVEIRETMASAGAIRYDKDKVQTSPEDVMANYMIRLEAVEKREKDLLLDYYEKYERIQRQISGLDSGLQTSVLSLRYLDCKMFSDIAYDLGYSESYIWHVHQKALKNFGRRYLDGDKESRKKQI